MVPPWPGAFTIGLLLRFFRSLNNSVAATVETVPMGYMSPMFQRKHCAPQKQKALREPTWYPWSTDLA